MKKTCSCASCDEDKCPCMPNINSECCEDCSCGCNDVSNLVMDLE
jgi:hypothetical protein